VIRVTLPSGASEVVDATVFDVQHGALVLSKRTGALAPSMVKVYAPGRWITAEPLDVRARKPESAAVA
jgi:hypothetical protein